MKIEDSPAISHKQTGQSLNSGVKIFVFISIKIGGGLFETKTVKLNLLTSSRRYVLNLELLKVSQEKNEGAEFSG